MKQIEKILNVIKAPLSDRWGWVLLTLIATYSFTLTYYPRPVSEFYQLPKYFMLWSFVNTFSFFLLARFPGAFRGLSALLIGFIVSINLSFIIFLGSKPTGGAIASALETNFNEAMDFLGHVKMIPFVIFFVISGAVYWVAGKVRGTGRVGMAALCLITLWPMARLETDKRLAFDFSTNPISTLSFMYHKSLLLSDILDTMSNRHESARLIEESKRKRELPVGALLSNAAGTLPRTLVLVIGESAAKSHYGIYGYQFGTDKNLQNLVSEVSRTVVIKNAIAPAPITRDALTLALSFASPINNRPYVENMNILEMAKYAGYHTVWISNQQQVGLHDTNIGVMANTADEVHFNTEGGLDINLVNFLKIQLQKNRRQLVVLHLMGSHISYARQHDNMDYKAASLSPEEFRHYDATIAHTDRVLGAVASLLRSQDNALMVYVPDHGEIVNVGHGLLKLDRNQYDIPMVIWGDAGLVASMREKTIFYSDKSSGYFNTTNLPFVLSEIMGFEFNQSLKDRAILEASYFLNVDGKHYPISQIIGVTASKASP